MVDFLELELDGFGVQGCDEVGDFFAEGKGFETGSPGEVYEEGIGVAVHYFCVPAGFGVDEFDCLSFV